MVMQSLLPQGVRLNPRRTFEVCEGMSIQAAINAAAVQVPAPSATNPWTILIYPGTYVEVGAIIMSPYVNLKGIGPKGSGILYRDTGGFLVYLANPVEIDNVTLRFGTLTGQGWYLFDNSVACVVKASHITFDVLNPGAQKLQIVLLYTTSIVTLENCSANLTGGPHYLFRGDGTGGGTFRLFNNDFEVTSGRIFYFDKPGFTVISHGNRYAGATGLFFLDPGGTGSDFTFENDAIIVASMIGPVKNSRITYRNCAISPAVLAESGSVVRLKNCSYRGIARSASSNIVDESPHLQDAPWKVQKWTWQAVLAQSQVSIRGTPDDAGTGQILLKVTDNVPDVEAVERFNEIAGSLANAFYPERTPRFLTQISVEQGGFDTHVTMFFGLRAVLGNAVPGAAEHHAGFDWDGTNFRAISSNGAGVGQQTNLTTPSVSAQHQLEVIVIGGVQVEFYIDGDLVATHDTAAGRPTAALDWQHLLATAGGGTGDVIYVTVRPGGCQECPA